MVVEKGGVNSLEFTVKCGIPLLRRVEFGGEKGKRLPHSMNLLLEHSSNMANGGISGKGDRNSGMRMEKKSGRGQNQVREWGLPARASMRGWRLTAA